ncbi:hypothetical protein [Thermodesulfovibrio yellowstonii]|uniref:hypothetical protein n=1 Tax=Thermodesulfovibrio yellowstonii TaxID=28262 RepID=UPI0003F50623|nr:hypothetical protein [Thermodesulfovibrio islandicus]
MPKLIEFLTPHEIFPRLSLLFPAMIETAKDVEVIPWQEEFAVADKNPEVIDSIEFFELLFKNGVITEEECRDNISKILSQAGYSSRTEGIAFIEDRQVAFRSPKPSISVVLHELGHIHFGEPDIIWSATYGGGEALMWLGLSKKFYIDEPCVLFYHTLLKEAYEKPQDVAKQVATVITEKIKIDCYPHIATLALFAGTILDGVMNELREKRLEHLFSDLLNPEWEKITPTRTMVWGFLVDLVEGLKWNDSFYSAYAKALGLLKPCPVCGRIPCMCD